MQTVRQAALGVRLSLRLAELKFPLNPEAYRRAFAAIGDQRVDALAIHGYGANFTHRQLIVALVEELKLPAVYVTRVFVDLGGPMAYSVDFAEVFRHAARQVAQILEGANPGDIPFFQATKAAKALSLTIPPSVLARADDVSE